MFGLKGLLDVCNRENRKLKQEINKLNITISNLFEEVETNQTVAATFMLKAFQKEFPLLEKLEFEVLKKIVDVLAVTSKNFELEDVISAAALVLFDVEIPGDKKLVASAITEFAAKIEKHQKELAKEV